MTATVKFAMARAIAGMGRMAGGMGKGLGSLGLLGAGVYGVGQAGKTLQSFNPQNPAAVGQSIMQIPSRTKSYQDDLGQVMDWAQNPTGRPVR